MNSQKWYFFIFEGIFEVKYFFYPPFQILFNIFPRHFSTCESQNLNMITLPCFSAALCELKLEKFKNRIKNSSFSKSQVGMSTISQVAEFFAVSRDSKELSLVKNSSLFLNCFYIFYSVNYSYIFNFGLQANMAFYIYYNDNNMVVYGKWLT